MFRLYGGVFIQSVKDHFECIVACIICNIRNLIKEILSEIFINEFSIISVFDYRGNLFWNENFQDCDYHLMMIRRTTFKYSRVLETFTKIC